MDERERLPVALFVVVGFVLLTGQVQFGDGTRFVFAIVLALTADAAILASERWSWDPDAIPRVHRYGVACCVLVATSVALFDLLPSNRTVQATLTLVPLGYVFVLGADLGTDHHVPIVFAPDRATTELEALPSIQHSGAIACFVTYMSITVNGNLPENPWILALVVLTPFLYYFLLGVLVGTPKPGPVSTPETPTGRDSECAPGYERGETPIQDD
ncbi:hypothetical protein [Halococcoides cellulosivorans]|uniref:Uncharacterized protein n=1 Tax=Halococcoides cellulosivorans TaxID=1679096 RepID=A0A2R4WYP7_9EURY|nr:hypothetical protein [Halococcoides cellulosivorans]AWB26644.1 hypothetical protein HARCEL1_02410 [Halococcoides cellulosivorans]